MKLGLFLVCATIITLTSACGSPATFQPTPSVPLTSTPQVNLTQAVTANAPSPATPANRTTPDLNKLSPRLTLLVQSPAVLSASPEDLARALSLPVQGPGSLRRDEQGRLQVTIRITDASDSMLMELTKVGAVIISISQTYQEVTAFVPVGSLVGLSIIPQVLSVTEDLAPGAGGG